jgi:hypothetical protein
MSCLHGPPLGTRYRGRVGYIAHVHHCDINARVGETSPWGVKSCWQSVR